VTPSDAAFLLRLLNEPSWLENIGDRGVRSCAEAEDYINKSIRAQFEAHGYGMYALQLRSTGMAIGICGLVKRDFLSAPDLGFALLSAYVGQGYATEAAQRMMSHSEENLGITRLYAITKPGNHRSVRVLERLGFRYQGPCPVPQGVEVELYATGCP